MSETSAHDSAPETPKTSKTRDRLVKLAFVAVAAAIFLILRCEGGEVRWPNNWQNTDFRATMQRARRENRRVVVICTYPTPGADARRMAQKPLTDATNLKTLEQGRYLTVRVPLEGEMETFFRETYDVTKTPTTLILGPTGWEYNRREGYIGQLPFSQEFLSGREVMRAGVRGWRKVSTVEQMDAALRQAAEEDRPVLLLFTPEEPDEATEALYERTLADKAVRAAIRNGRYLLVHAPLAEGEESPLAERFDVLRVPALIRLDRDGRVRRRLVRRAPEEGFVRDFLGGP
jgi:hypothetical protein